MKPPKPKLTEHDKWRKKELDNILVTRNRCLSFHNFKQIRTRADLKKFAGVPADKIDPVADCFLVSREDIVAFFRPYEEAIEVEYKRRSQPEAPQADKSVNIHPKHIDEDELKPCEEHEKLPPCALQKAFLFPFQERAARQLLDNILVGKKRGQLLRAAVGTGKTFIIGAVACRLEEAKFTQGKTYSPWAQVYITRASIVEQTERVLEKFFSINTVTGVHVINIEQLRASFGELMVRCETVVEQGEEHIVWKWRPSVHPCVMYIDECQAVKNEDSQQSRIMQAFNDLPGETYQIFFSATPFLRVAEAKCFCVSTRIPYKYGVATSPLCNAHWSDFAKAVAAPAEPEEYSPAAVERLMDRMKDYIVDVKGVRSQFKAINSVQLIDFQTEDEAKFYHQAWARYEAMMEKIKGYQLSASQSRFLILAQFTVFRKAAELCRCEYYAKTMFETVQTGKQVAALAVGFKGTIRRTTDILVNKYGVSRDDITLVWGGGKTKATKKQENKKAVVTNEAMMAVLKDLGLSLDSLGLSDVEDYVDEEEDPALRLGTQSLKQRQVEIDRFQSGKSHYCMFTFKAGGVGLSLHHTDELTEVKARRKKNGWAMTEDIPLVPTRQRICILSPTFSAIELVQGLGRCPRLTSLSDTPQVVVFYRNTIEERVAAIVSLKLRCLRKVVRTQESWEDTIVGGYAQDDTKLIDNGVKQTMEPQDEPAEVDGFFGDEEEEE